MFMMLYGALGCCSLLRIVTLTPVMIRGENLTRPAPKVGGSRDDLRLPFYTSGFE